MAATGYGRARWAAADVEISEITAHALGNYLLLPQVRTIIDIGGQDAKAIALDELGKMTNFVINDKCAAGTGRFLDVMAGILGLDLGELGDMAAKADNPVSISSTCTVFAESEVISQLAKGAAVPDVVAGICASVAGRVASLVKRVGVKDQVCMSGGVALNEGVRRAMEQVLGTPVVCSPMAQLAGALGAALFAYHKVNSTAHRAGHQSGYDTTNPSASLTGQSSIGLNLPSTGTLIVPVPRTGHSSFEDFLS